MHGETEPHGSIGVEYTGGFAQCPECGSDAELIIWGEGVDADFKCLNDDCDARDGIR